MRENHNLQWQIDISVIINKYMQWQFLKGLGIGAFIMAVFMGVFIFLEYIRKSAYYQPNFNSFKYMFFVINILFWLTALCMFLLYAKKYVASYSLNSKEIKMRTRKKGKKNKALHEILFFLNTFTYQTNPAAFSPYALRRSENITIKWKNVRKIIVIPKHQTIIIKGEIGVKMIVFYTQDDKNTVFNAIRSYCPKVQTVER